MYFHFFYHPSNKFVVILGFKRKQCIFDVSVIGINVADNAEKMTINEHLHCISWYTSYKILIKWADLYLYILHPFRASLHVRRQQGILINFNNLHFRWYIASHLCFYSPHWCVLLVYLASSSQESPCKRSPSSIFNISPKHISQI